MEIDMMFVIVFLVLLVMWLLWRLATVHDKTILMELEHAQAFKAAEREGLMRGVFRNAEIESEVAKRSKHN